MKRVVVVGPESTGKTQLTQQLAAHYHVPWVHEVARDYLDKLQRPYRYQDLLQIAKEQVNLEQQVAQAHCCFCDTDLLVIKVWSMIKYQKVHPWIEERLVQAPADFYLLTTVDLPWEPDPLREHPMHREELFEVYQQQLNQYGFPHALVSGVGDLRLKNAIEQVDSLCKQI